MTREITGAIRGARKLAEALDDLRAAGIGGDRIRMDGVAGNAADPCAAVARDMVIATHWMNAEYAGHGEHLGVVDWHDRLFDTGYDGAPAQLDPSAAHDSDCTRVIVSIANDTEMFAVCDVFCRLGTADVDASGIAA